MTTGKPKPQLGKYQVTGSLGKGSFGQVVLAFDTELQRQAALKILHPNLTGDTLFIDHFIREARIAANLHGHHLVQIYDVGQAGGFHYIAMQYMPGGTLRQRLDQEKRLSLPDTVKIISQLAQALEVLHNAKLVHQDIKPSNILFDEHGQAYLSDFGLTRASESSNTTASRGIPGTPPYISPEIAAERTIDARSDIYTLGVVAYEMLAGRTPFQSNSLIGYVRQHADEPPPPPARFNPQTSQDVQDVLLKALAKDPAERYSSAIAFAAALESAATQPFRPAATQMPTKQLEPASSQSPVTPANKEIPTRPPTQLQSSQPGRRPTPKAPKRKASWAMIGGILGLFVISFAAVSTVVWLWLNGGPTGITPASSTGRSSPVAQEISNGGRIPPTATPAPTQPPAATLPPTPIPTATVTQTLAPTATLPPAPIDIAGLPVLFQDDFSANTGWRLMCEWCNSNVEVKKGELVLSVRDNILVGSTPDLVFDNFVLEADGRWSGGAVGGRLGAIFRYEESEKHNHSYYLFTVGNDGRFEIGKAVEKNNSDDWDMLITGFSDAINRTGEMNRFHIEANKRDMRFFINGKFLATLHDVDLDLGIIILYAWKTHESESFEASFDNLIITTYPQQP